MKVIYLTIDDAPSGDFQSKIAYLVERKIPAIFFCRGNALEGNEIAVGEAIKLGFIIGNHSYSHPHFSELSFEQAKEEILKTEKILEKMYSDSGIQRAYKLFRFPYGDKGNSKSPLFYRRIQELLREQGFSQPDFNIRYPYFRELGLDKDIDTYWTVNFQEYKNPPLEEAIGRIEKNDELFGGNLLDLSSPDILLIHDHEHTKHLFYPMVDKISRMDVEFRVP